MPNFSETNESTRLLHQFREHRYLLKEIFVEYGDCYVQNAYYEDYVCSVEASNLLVHNFKEK